MAECIERFGYSARIDETAGRNRGGKATMYTGEGPIPSLYILARGAAKSRQLLRQEYAAKQDWKLMKMGPGRT